MKTTHIFKILLFALILKLLYIGFAFLVEEYHDDFTFPKSTAGVISLFQRHDSYWYQSIHDDGYPEVNSKRELGWNEGSDFHQSRWGFMPGYPLATKLLSSAFNWTFPTSAFVVSTLLSILCFILFYWLACLWFDKRSNAFFTTLLFMALPFQFYFSMMYTESLFCSLLLGSFLAAYKKKYILLAILTGLNVIVRPVGLIMLMPLILFILENENLLKGFRLKRATWRLRSLKRLWFLIIPVLTFGAYCLYQYLETGYPNAYSIAQQGGWYREFMFPLAGLFRQGNLVTQFTSWYAIAMMIVAALAWKKLPLSYNLVIWIGILLPLSAGTSVGMPRYITVLFPLFFVLAQWLRPLKWRVFLIPFFTILQLFSFYFWLISHSVSQ